MLAHVGLAQVEGLAEVADRQLAVPQLVDDEQPLGVGDRLAHTSVQLVQLGCDVSVHDPILSTQIRESLIRWLGVVSEKVPSDLGRWGLRTPG